MFSGEEGHSSGAGVKSGMLKQSLQVEDVAGEEATGAVEVNKIISDQKEELTSSSWLGCPVRNLPDSLKDEAKF